jgi:L-ascorbate metabolism protein UlaG (beta-lactamase superfamily)
MGFIIGIGIIACAIVWFNRSLSARRYIGEPSDHFNGSIFFNVRPTTQKQSDVPRQKSLIRWLLTRTRGAWNKKNVTPAIPAHRVTSGITITFINHATVLIQCDGINILTDPVWAYRVSPIPFLGPARYTNAGIRFEDLPPIHIVLLSHNHYDHMDLSILRKMYKTWNPRIYTGLGNAAYLKRKGIGNAHDMDWWDEIHDGTCLITAVPAQHFSARAFSDQNRTLWCGFVLKSSSGNIYFAGDTGYGSFVADIAKRFESFACALIPIGAYEPSWMMRPVHMDPAEALCVHRELSVQTSIGIHHGTFRLTDEAQDEPRTRIEAERAESDFRVLENGESIAIGQ